MKSKILLLILSSALATWAAFTVPWQTNDAGGGASSATIGVTTWKLTGTIGQWDAHATQSTNAAGYALDGGYWAIAVPTEGGGPRLTITLSGPTALIKWNADAVGYKLQYSDNLTQWTDYATTITGASSMYWSLGNGPRYFFRLKHL